MTKQEDDEDNDTIEIVVAPAEIGTEVKYG
jgi:hypothetical protein